MSFASSGKASAIGGVKWPTRPTRTSIILLTTLLLASVVISSLTIKLLNGQRSVLEDTIRDSQAQAIALLANRIEQAVMIAVRRPFLALKNISPQALDERRFEMTRRVFPQLQQALLLDPEMAVMKALPAPKDDKGRQLDDWIAQRISLKNDFDKEDSLLYTFIEIIDDRPVLFAVQHENELDKQAGWILLRFNLDMLRQGFIEPLLGAFVAKEGGHIELQDAEAPWEDEALNWPVGKALPGWLLVFKPSHAAEQKRLERERDITLGVTTGVILALLIATFAVWRELGREHALVDLRNRFVANVSHELKTPLTLIRMYAETLYLRRIADVERIHQYHGVMLHEAERLSQMINAVLDFSRLSRGLSACRLTEVDLAGTVRGVLDRYRWRAEEAGMTLELDLEEGVPPTPHDPDAITQVLLNLIDNAVKYAAAGKRIRISLRDRGKGVELVVGDQGPGIPPGKRQRLRKPFQRGALGAYAGGAGLGLALVDEIARAHRGQLLLEGAVGGGLEAIIRFPKERRVI
jgi:signal transduction histidine kinase